MLLAGGQVRTWCLKEEQECACDIGVHTYPPVPDKPLLAFKQINNVISMLMNLSHSDCDSENWNEATAL